MSAERTLWNLATLLALLLTALVPAYVAYDLYGRGPSPEKQLELIRISPINPLADLSALRDEASISVILKNQTLDNLVIGQAYFRNVGAAPIVPDDYHENLSASVKKPWNIVAVENQRRFGQSVPLEWRRVSATRFEAEPALLNPGDQVAVRVYLTNTASGGPFVSDPEGGPEIEWNARITNLRAFYEPPDLLERFEREYSTKWGIVVHLAGWGVPLTIVAALLFQTLYVHLLACAGYLRKWGWYSISLIVLASLLSFTAAECIATYLFGGFMTNVTGVDHFLNAPPIVLHAVVLIFLWWKARTSPAKSPT